MVDTAAADTSKRGASVGAMGEAARGMKAGTKATNVKSGATLADLKPDSHNARNHNPRNIGMLVDSLHQVGAARSIVIDESNTVLAGNGVLEAAAEAGITKLQIVEADGETVIAVRRRGLSVEQKLKLALYDNRTAELAEWDTDTLQALQQQGEDLSAYFRENELEGLLASFQCHEIDPPTLASGEKSPFQQMTFTLHDEQAEQVNAAIEKAKGMGAFDTPNENSNGNALARVCEVFLGVG